MSFFFHAAPAPAEIHGLILTPSEAAREQARRLAKARLARDAAARLLGMRGGPGQRPAR